ncbi:MAG TPA: hypothetical protein VHY20_04035 [Pirellulales bacterium]|nr:hypothetical protein [Pirellulales bacterium]
MQLDKTRVAIRERGFLDIMDLAVRATRGHASALVSAWVVGVLPLALLNVWALRSHWPSDTSEAVPTAYLWNLALAMVWEIPLATAPLTLYLGQALFVERPNWRELAGQYFSRWGQLFWYQVVLRGFLPFWAIVAYLNRANEGLLVFLQLATCLVWLYLYIVRPYLNEILLLERTPWQTQQGRASTLSRAANMHAHASADLFGRWITASFMGAMLITAGFLAMCWVRQTLTFEYQFDAWTYQLLLPLAAWLAIGYFAVVRFLSYLDLRIRTEGWEVELLLRAEGARLARQAA